MVMEIDLFHLVGLPPMDEQLAILPTLGHKICLDIPKTGSSFRELRRIYCQRILRHPRVSMLGNE